MNWKRPQEIEPQEGREYWSIVECVNWEGKKIRMPLKLCWERGRWLHDYDNGETTVGLAPDEEVVALAEIVLPEWLEEGK